MLVSNYEMRIARDRFPHLLSDSSLFSDSDQPANVQVGLRLPKSFFDSIYIPSASRAGVQIKALLTIRSLSNGHDDGGDGLSTEGDGWFLDSGDSVIIPWHRAEEFFYFNHDFDPEKNYEIRIYLSLHTTSTNNNNKVASASTSPHHSRAPTPSHLLATRKPSPNPPLVHHSRSLPPSQSPSPIPPIPASVNHLNAHPHSQQQQQGNNNKHNVTSALTATTNTNHRPRTPSKTLAHSRSQPLPQSRPLSRQPSPSPLQAPPLEPSHVLPPSMVISLAQQATSSPLHRAQPSENSHGPPPSIPLHIQPSSNSPVSNNSPSRSPPPPTIADASSSNPNISPLPVIKLNGKAVGYIIADFSALRHTEDERALLRILGTSGQFEPNPHFAELIIKWPQILPHSTLDLFLEVRMRIQYGSGWPFSSRRPFFIMYRWETDVSSWSAVYRSEVLTEPSQTPDADGAMVFRMINFPLRAIIGEYGKRPLRIEFFHYKMSEDAKLLAYVETSIFELRHTMDGSRLLLVLNIFPRGELVGNIVLHQSRLTASRYFFSLQANFGGPVSGMLVFFGVVLVDLRRAKKKPQVLGLSPRRAFELRPFFTLSRYTPSVGITTTTTNNDVPTSNSDNNTDTTTNTNDDDDNNNNTNQNPTTTVTTTITTTTTTTTTTNSNSNADTFPKFAWEEVYRSEQTTRNINSRHYNFRIAKLSERKLNASQNNRIIAVNLYRTHRRGPVLFAYFLTNVETLLQAELGSVFPLILGTPESNVEFESYDDEPEDGTTGYAKLDFSMKRGSRMSFSVTIYLGQRPPEGAHIHAFPQPR